MTDLTRDEIARMLASAWPAPWRKGKYDLSDDRGQRIVSWDYATNDDEKSTAESDNCELIEAAPTLAAQCLRLLDELTAAERERDRLRFWSEISDDEASGWCGEHPRRVEDNTAGMLNYNTDDGADLCLACECRRLLDENARLREASLGAIRVAWRSGYLAAAADVAEGTLLDGEDGCHDPDEYLDEALAAIDAGIDATKENDRE